jgi:trimeric autotransporter adhesin
MLFRPVDNNPEFMRFVDGTGAVFNEEGADHDFRIESDINANAFFLQGSDGKIGIGTASPLQSLHVNSNGNTLLLISSTFNNSTITGLTVDTVGDSSVFRLNVSKSGAIQGVLSFLHSSSSALQVWNLAISGSDVYRAGYSEHIWKTGNTERLRITSTGSVGIGTSSPSALLDVDGDALVNGLTVGLGAGSVASNTAVGYQALDSNTTGSGNVANGLQALYSNTTGDNNTANGYRALYSNTEGDNNTATGVAALYSNTEGNGNVANGHQALYSNTTGNNNTANGRDALYSNTTGGSNSASGYQALYSNTTGLNSTANGREALYSNTTGNYNTANGRDALYSNTEGNNNSANGYRALYSNTEGDNNTATGVAALYSNTEGNNNSANGYQALYSNTTGNSNLANGRDALYSNTTGGGNSAVGYQALYSNTNGGFNAANGYQALYSNTSGNNNVASGRDALYSNTTGGNNVSNGYQALYSNTTAFSNVANGHQALYSNTTGAANTASGREALYSNTTGQNNTADGYQALYNNTTGAGNTAISPRNSAGTYAPVFDPTTEDHRFCMGSTSVTNAYIQVAWTVVSDERDKTELAPVPHGLDFVRALKPTSFRYKADRDSTEGHGPTRYGFLAQEVLALEGDNPVIIDNENPEKLRMTDQSLIAVLVNAIQDQQKIIEGLEQRITAMETN